MSDLSMGMWDELADESATLRAQHRNLLATTAAAEFSPFLSGATSATERAHRMAYIEPNVRSVVASSLRSSGYTDSEVEVGIERALASLHEGAPTS